MAWSNWSQNQTASPSTYLKPKTAEELASDVATAPRPLRVVGAGHSFTGIVPSDGSLLSLDDMPDQVEPNDNGVWVSAGTRLFDLSEKLESHNLAFRNLGDINVQSLAGAVSTATHGTGKTLPCLAAELTGFEFVSADGSVIRIDDTHNAGWVGAAQVSLGCFGVMSRARVHVIPAYKLRRQTYPLPIGELIEKAPALWDQHRNFEFFYIPFSGYGTAICHDVSAEPVEERTLPDDDAGLAVLKSIRNDLKGDSKSRREILAGALSESVKEDVVGASWKLLASPRNTPFNEMEYHLPVETALDTLKRVIDYIESERPDVFFPIEVRQTAGDRGWLSPFNGGNRISIAVHAAHDEPHDFFFTDIEPMFRDAGGRPHWGKLHSLKAEDLQHLYPRLPEFRAVMKMLDPVGAFRTPYLKNLLGV